MLNRNVNGTWVAEMQPRTDGKWTAFMVHLEYEGPKKAEFTGAKETARVIGGGGVDVQAPADWPISSDGRYQMTTTVSIIPQTYPFPDCHGESCRGKLV